MFEDEERPRPARSRKVAHVYRDEEAEPTGPRVVMRGWGEALEVFIEPPLLSGEHRRMFSNKICAWAYARELWECHRLGFSEQSTANSVARD